MMFRSGPRAPVLLLTSGEQGRHLASQVERLDASPLTAPSCQAGVSLLDEAHCPVVVLDLGLEREPGCSLSAAEAIPLIRERHPDTEIIALCRPEAAAGPAAAAALSAGACACVVWPAPAAAEALQKACQAALERARLRQENQRLQRRLGALEAEWEETLDTIPEAIAICDGSGRVLRGNRALRDTAGVGDVRLRAIDEVLAPLGLGARIAEALAEGRVISCEESVPGGRTFTATISPIDREGPEAAIVLVRDVTGERRMQRRLLLGERMAAVGQLAAGLAHEINNPVSFAYSNLQLARQILAQQRRPDLPLVEMSEMLDECMVGLGRVRDIVRDLRTFTSTEVRGQTGEVCLDDLLDLAVRLTRSEVQRRARLVYEREMVPTPPIRGDAGKLSHVLLNLLSHALHNLPPPDETGGTVHSITARTRTDRARGVVEVLVADSGPTLPEEVRAHLFEPFAQRRVRLSPDVSAAIGMGLAVSYEVVRRHGGEIEARPGTEGGNELLVHLPLPDAPAVGPGGPGGSSRRRVLFVDDEPGLLRGYQRLIGDQHEVTTVGSGREALALLCDGEPFDAIFCDVVMPGLDGPGLYRAVAARDPACAGRFVFLSQGGAFSPELTTLVGQIGAPTLDKPPDREALLRAIERVG